MRYKIYTFVSTDLLESRQLAMVTKRFDTKI